MSEYFPKQNALGINVKIELKVELVKYVAKASLKNETGSYKSIFTS